MHDRTRSASARRRRHGLALAVIVAAAIAAPAPAHADDFNLDPWAWGFAAGEVSTVGYAALRFSDKIPGDGFTGLAANLAPAVIGTGVGLAAYHYDLDARPALAAHGAVWGGCDLLLLGMLIDGRNQRDGLRTGPATWTLGALGVVAGGVAGATAGNRWREGWLTAPTVGLLAGGAVGGMVVMFSGDIGGDRSVQRFAIGVVGGLSLAMVTTGVLGALQDSAPPPGASPRALVPQIGSDRFVLSFGGAF